MPQYYTCALPNAAAASNFIYNHQMPRKPIIAVVGAGRETEPAVSNARELGRLIAEQGWVLVTGGRNAGVMRAASEGAKRSSAVVNKTGRNTSVSEGAKEENADKTITIGVLPNKDTEVSPDVDIVIVTDTGEARNNIIVLSADVVIACGVDDPGTASEVSLALKAGKPVLLVDIDDRARVFFLGMGNTISAVESAKEAIDVSNRIISEIKGQK